MPELDFMVTADYVRVEGGVLHMIAAGFDTIYLPAVPVRQQIGVGMRILVDVADAQQEHKLALIFQGPDGERLAEVHGTFTTIPGQPLPPDGRPYGLPAAFNLPLPIPVYGDYSLELFIDNQAAAVKSITLTVAPIPDIPDFPGHA